MLYKPIASKVSINGSGLKIPRIVSLKNSLTYRSGPEKSFSKFELNKKDILKNNCRVSQLRKYNI